MRIHHIIAIIYSVLIIINLFENPIVWWSVGICVLIIVMMCAMAKWLDLREGMHLQMMEWLSRNHRQLTDRPEYYHDSPFPFIPISRHTKLRSFKAVTSFIVATIDDDVEPDFRSSFLRGFIATLWTMLFGWWGLPWGPVKTIHVILSNISGGKVITIGQLIESKFTHLENLPETQAV